MQEELSILLLEDVDEDAHLIERVLKKSGIPFSLHRVDSRAEFEEALSRFSPNVILSDHALPQFNSIEALRLSRSKLSNIPFILVTGTVSEEFAVTCLKQGIDDYILKTNLTRSGTAPAPAERRIDAFE
jgi:CheY-like chemotaxis protein